MSTFTDDRTPQLDLELPHVDNLTKVDVNRLRSMIGKIDTFLSTLETNLGTTNQNLALAVSDLEDEDQAIRQLLAQEIADLQHYGQYFGDSPTAPSTTEIGSMYLDTSVTPNVVKVLTTTGWAPAVTVSVGGRRTQDYTATAGQTGPFTVEGGFTTGDVYVNGVLLRNGSEVTLAPGASGTFTIVSELVAGDLVAFRGFLANDATDIYTKSEINTSRVRFDAAQALTPAQRGQAIANMGGGILSGFRDKLINGDGRVNQRTYTTVADDVYWCDRHYVLTQTAAITPTILSDVANGLPSMMRLSQSQATAQRMGNAQIVEASASKRLRGKLVTLGGKVRCSSSQAIRYAVLEWTGTADVVTSDVVASWTNGAFTAGNFFLGSNLTVAAVGTITPAANTLTDWSMTANISGACNNLIVMMWTEDTAAQNVTLDMTWGLASGDATAETWPYEVRSTPQELFLCQWFGRLVGLCPDYTNGVSASAIYRTYTIPPMRAAPSGVVVTTPTGFTSGGGAATLTTFLVNFTKTTSFSVVAAAAVGISGWDNGASVFLNSEL